MNRLLLTLLLTLTALIYAPTLGYDFVAFDDQSYVSHNPMVQQGISLEGIRWALTSSEESNWHPITWFSHMLDAQLYGVERPGMHHLSSLLLHLLNSALVYLVFLRFFGHPRRALWIAAVFALHPLQIESVAWISERKNLLSSSFWLASLLAYERHARGQRRSSYMLCLLFLALGLASKPMLVTAPFLFMLLDAWPLRRSSARSLIEKIPMIAMVIAACVVTYNVQHAGGAVWEPPWGHRIANALTAYPRYVAKFFWPSNLAVLYPNHVGMWSRAEVIAASAFLVAISVALLRLRRSATPLVGWLWFMGTLVPVLGLVTVGRQSIGDRYTYIPLLGIALLSVWLFESIRRGRGGNRVGIAIAVLTLVPLSIRTTQQLPTWKDSGTLFRHALSVTKDNDAIHNNLGTWLMTTGRATAAVDNYRRALAISSDSFLPRKNLITVFEALQEFELAAEHLEFQIARWPEDLDRRFRAGSAHRISGNPQAALDHYEFIVRQDSGNAPAWNHRGGVLMDLLRFDAAIESFEKAIALDAKYDLAHRNLVDGLVQAKRKDEAITHLENALTADPENSELRRLAARLSDPFN